MADCLQRRGKLIRLIVEKPRDLRVLEPPIFAEAAETRVLESHTPRTGLLVEDTNEAEHSGGGSTELAVDLAGGVLEIVEILAAFAQE